MGRQLGLPGDLREVQAQKQQAFLGAVPALDVVVAP